MRIQSWFPALGLLLLPSRALAQDATPTPTPAPAASPAASPAAATTTAAPAATATPPPAPTPTPIPKYLEVTGAIEGGATATSGNTNVQTYTGALKADGKTRDGWGLALRGAGVWAESHNIQTAGSYDTSIRGDRKIYGIVGYYLKLSIDGDRFKGVNNRKGVGTGFSVAKGWRTAGTDWDHDALRGELGYQYYRVDLALTSKDQEIQAGRAFAGYAHAFSKESVFSEEVEGLYDFKVEDRFLITSVTSLSVKDDTQPDYVDPSDKTKGRFEKVDTITTFAVIFTF